MLRRACLLLAIVPLLAAGCGDSRSPAASLIQPATPHRFRTLRFPEQGLTISVPVGWLVARTHRPLVTVAASGNAIIALWCYARQGPVPHGVGLTDARRALVAGIRTRQPGAHILGSLSIRVDHQPAIVIETLAHISGLLRHIRSAHIYAPGEEVVLEEYAPTAVFSRLSQRVFVPVRRSLLISTP